MIYRRLYPDPGLEKVPDLNSDTDPKHLQGLNNFPQTCICRWKMHKNKSELITSVLDPVSSRTAPRNTVINEYKFKQKNYKETKTANSKYSKKITYLTNY